MIMQRITNFVDLLFLFEINTKIPKPLGKFNVSSFQLYETDKQEVQLQWTPNI